MINYASYFKNLFLPSLKGLFDVEWQKKGWGGLDKPDKYPGFDEVTMNFSEISEVVLSSPRAYNLSKGQEDKLRQLNDMIDTYDCSKNRPNDEREIINDPKWHEIQEVARLTYDDFKNITFDS